MKRIEVVAEKFSTAKWILIFFAGVVIAEVIFRSALMPPFLEISGGQTFLDLQTAFSVEDVENLFSVIGDEGQKIYGRLQLVDFFFPVCYGFAFCLLLSFLLMKIYPDTPENRWPIRFPLLAGAFDLIENLGIFILRKSYPPVNVFWSNFASIAGVMKNLFISLTMVFLVISLVRVLILNGKKKKGA